MDIQQLQALGAFAPTRPVKRTIEVTRPLPLSKEQWADPEIPEYTGETETVSIDVYIRFGSSADDIEIARAPEAAQPFVAVFRFVCNEDGGPVFESVEQASQLQTWLVVPLFAAIAEVRGGGSPKASKRKTSSGSKSR